MVLRIRVRFGKHDIAGPGESVRPPTTKRQRIDPLPYDSREDSGLQIMKAPKKQKKKQEEKKKMQKQPQIAAAGEIRKPIKLRILIQRPNYLPRQGFAAEVKKPPAVVQQPARAWALSPGQMPDSVSSFYEGGGESVSVNQAWRPTYFYYPEVNSYAGFSGGGRAMGTEGRPGSNKYNPVIISGDEPDLDDAESVGENDPVDDYYWSNDGEAEYSIFLSKRLP